ncbi:hypothetical protein BSKO_02121 [Bryopsis sp. KO-2023]|nr:hypothetical protein BSKO_02121 [Bryopsis sp. KO-2023]
MAQRSAAISMGRSVRRALNSIKDKHSSVSVSQSSSKSLPARTEECASRGLGRRPSTSQPFRSCGPQSRSMSKVAMRNPAALSEAMALLNRLRLMHYMVYLADEDGT